MPRPPPGRPTPPVLPGSAPPGATDDLTAHLLLDEDQLERPDTKGLRYAKRAAEVVFLLLLAALIVFLVRDDVWRLEHPGVDDHPGSGAGDESLLA